MLKYKSGTVITSLNMRKPVLEQRSSKVRVNNNKSSIFLTGLCVEIFFSNSDSGWRRTLVYT